MRNRHCDERMHAALLAAALVRHMHSLCEGCARAPLGPRCWFRVAGSRPTRGAVAALAPASSLRKSETDGRLQPRRHRLSIARRGCEPGQPDRLNRRLHQSGGRGPVEHADPPRLAAGQHFDEQEHEPLLTPPARLQRIARRKRPFDRRGADRSRATGRGRSVGGRRPFNRRRRVHRRRRRSDHRRRAQRRRQLRRRGRSGRLAQPPAAPQRRCGAVELHRGESGL